MASDIPDGPRHYEPDELPAGSFSTLFERSATRTASNDRRSMEELCAALISERGEVATTRAVKSMLAPE